MKLEIGKRYLFRKKWPAGEGLFELTVIEISQKAILLKNKHGQSYWHDKEEFEKENELFEELS